MNSIWNFSTQRPHFESLNGDIDVDVLIVGGGITGILCARALADADVNYALIEAEKICGGITQNTTAKITVQHGAIYNKLIREFGIQKARLYYQANNDALNEYKRLCANVDCDFEEYDAYLFSADNKRKIEKEAEAYKKLGINATYTTKLSLPFSVAAALRIGRQAQFNPLKFLYEISKDLRIFEETKAIRFEPGLVTTNRGKIRARKIIVATHFPVINKHGVYFLKMYQHRSYVLALKNAPQMAGTYIDEDEKGLSFRNYGEYLLLGGGSHRTGKKGGNWRELEEFAAKYYPNAQEVCRFATQDCMSLDGVPYIGKYSPATEGLYVASGFNKWGMTSSMVAAMLLRDEMLGKPNGYAEVFAPSRSLLRPQLAINVFQTVINLLTPTTPRCSHLGCALKYNKAEHTWDCPCHGSRFEENGKLIDNPATEDKPNLPKRNKRSKS
ncbi:MAG: FAD-dependent oxidoreductase [Candidatus Fimimonas sp.]